MHIVSASRRTDIPHYYARWFAERRRTGFAEYRTVYGGGRQGRFRASLRPGEVLGYLFWTKYAAPFHGELASLRAEGIPCVFQYTVTGYGQQIQPGIPPSTAVVDDFLRVARLLPGPEAIQWRYDPVLVSPDYDAGWHLRNFRRLVARLEGATRVVNVSFVEPYLKALAKAPDRHAIRWRRPDPLRHRVALARYPGIPSVGADEDQLLRDLADIARQRGMELRVCCNREYAAAFPAARCCDAELFRPYGPGVGQRVAALKPGPSRPGCGCLKTVDIGMETTCPAGCFYCYVTTSVECAVRNHGRHDPLGTMLRSPS